MVTKKQIQTGKQETDLDNGNNTSIELFVIQGSTQNNQQSILVTGSQIQLNTWYNVVFYF